MSLDDTTSDSTKDITLKRLYEEIIKSKNEVKSSISATEARLLLEIHSLKTRVDQLERENSTLEQKFEYADRVNRKNNIILFGFDKLRDNATPKLICEELNHLLEVEISESDISDCYKLGKTKKSPIKVELISNLKKKVIFSKVKKLKGTNQSIANDLTLKQRNESKILRTNLIQARANTSCKSFIRGNRLVIGTKQYTVEDLVSIQPERKPHSAPSTPSTSSCPTKVRKNLQDEESQDSSEAGWETTDDHAETSRALMKTPLNSNESPGIPRIQKPSKKKSPHKKESKLGMKLRTGSAKS